MSEIINKKLHPYYKTGIYGWIGEEVDDNDYIICPICGDVLGMNYWDYSAENNGDNKCPKCKQELDYSEIYEFEDTCYYEQLVEMKDQKISDLEAKLAESESRFQAHKQNDARIIQDQTDLIENLKQQVKEKEERINWLVEAEFNRKWAKKYLEMRRKEDPMLCLPDSDEVYERYFELKQQLAEKAYEADERYKDWQEEIRECDGLRVVLAEVRKQLAEKDKLLREKIGSLKTTDFIRLCLDCGFMVDAKDKDSKEKIEFAIKKLYETKKNLRERVCLMENDEHCYPQNAVHWQDVVAIIDKQIKELKGVIYGK